MKRLAGLLAIVVVLGVLAGAGTTQKAPSATYTQVLGAYMEGKWDTLETTFKNSTKEIAALDKTEAADVTTMKNIIAESRGTWWNAIKASKRNRIKAILWGRTLPFTFDPEMQGSLNRNNVNNTVITTVNWLIADMDNAAAAEHGFSKGDLACLGVYKTLGMADSWNVCPPLSMQAGDAEKTAFLRYLEFRGNVTAAEYGTPRSRQWTIFLSLLNYKREFEKVNTRNSARAIAAMFLTEVLSHPKTYPSIELPKTAEGDDPEESLAMAVVPIIEKKQWTFAEDNELRAAFKTFAAANLAKPFKDGKIELPNKLFFALDPEADKPLLAKRNQWIKQQLDKAK